MGVDSSTSTDPSIPSTASTPNHDARTINPSLLEKSADPLNSVPKSKFTFEAATTKKLPTIVPETGRQGSGRVDMLQKAKEMGIKIWQLEKLERILLVMLDTPTSPHAHNTRSHPAAANGTKLSRQQGDLQQLLKNEQINGPAEREAKLATSDLIPLKGPHIYIRCMNEKTKPILVREYPKVQNKEDGEWPQIRSVSAGKCPFIEEDTYSRRQHEREKTRDRDEARQNVKKKTVEEAGAPRTRSNVVVQATRMQPPPFAGRKRPLEETQHGANAMVRPAQQLPPPATMEAAFSKPASTGTYGSFPAHSRIVGGEPMASGMQANNVTSAIRSQITSSTAAAPGGKAGTSKEIHGLQRKVLERNNSGPITYAGLTASKRMTDITAAARENPRAAKQKANEKLGHKMDCIHEDSPSDDELNRQPPNRASATRVLKKEKKDLKPGYCENCREKFEDFDEVSFRVPL